MKRNLTKLMAALALLVCISLPSVGWGQTYTLQPVTSVEAGGLYVFEQGEHVMNNTVSSSALQTTTSYVTSALEGTETYVWTLESATDGFYLKNVSLNNNPYLNNASSTGVSFGAASSVWAFNFQDDGTVLIQNKSNSDRFLGYTSATSYAYKAYVTSNLSTYPHAINVYQLEENSDIPFITVNNVDIAYDATGGEIEYSVSNPADEGELTAEAPGYDWLHVGEVGDESVAFTCDMNNASAARTATVQLTYTYDTDQSVTKNVTVTQTGNPNVIDNISDITAAGTYTVVGTIVAKSLRGFVVGDGTGYVYYYNQNYSQSSYAIGDMVKISGAVSASTSYKVFQYNSDAIITAAETSNYETEDPAVLTGAEMETIVTGSNVILSNYVQYVGTLTVNGTYYNITDIDGAATAQGSISYPTNTDFTSLDGKTVVVTGYYVGVSGGKYFNTMLGSIEEVIVDDPTITVTSSLSPFTYIFGNGPSTPQTIMVSGSHLEADITVALEANSKFEMTKDPNGRYTSSVTLAKTEDMVDVTPVYIRLKANLELGDYSAEITLSSQNATTRTVIVTGSVTIPQFTWDLSTDQTATATTTEMTWTSDFATMGVVKANATTNTNNYYPGTSGQNYTSTRFYKNSVLTIAPVQGYLITSVVFTATNHNYAIAFKDSGWTNATATMEEGDNVTVVTVTPEDGAAEMVATIGGTCGFTAVTVYYEVNNNPVITPRPVHLAYDATSGEIVYSLDNEAEDGTMSASTEADWITLGDNFDSPIAFTCTENTAGTERTATVTLTYTYDTDQSISADVTVTQDGNPNFIMTIAEVRAMELGTTVVTKGVVTNVTIPTSGSNKTVYMQDDNAGIVVYGAFETDVVVGDEIRVEGELTAYSGLMEIGTNANAPTVTVLSQDNEVTPVVKTIAEISNDIQAILVRVEEATVAEIDGNNTAIVQGNDTIVVYKITGVSVDDVISLTANVGCHNNDPELVNPTDVEIQARPSITVVVDGVIEFDASEHEGVLPLTYTELEINEASDFAVVFFDADGGSIDNPDWIMALVENDENEGYNVWYGLQENEGETRTAYFKVIALGDEDYVYSNLVTIVQDAPAAPAETYMLYSSALVEGDYIIFYDGSAMNNTVNNNRLQYVELTPSDDAIITNDASIVWHIAPSGDYWTIYSADAQQYAASTSSNNQAQLVAEATEDNAKWTVSMVDYELGTYDFVNVARYTDADSHAYLRNNKNSTSNFGFACYGSGTGGALSLYKKVDDTPFIAVTLQLVELESEASGAFLSVTYANLSDEPAFDVLFVDADGEETEYDWLGYAYEDIESIEIQAQTNDGEARTAYVMVVGFDVDDNIVRSNIVTISQAAAPQQYTLTVSDLSNVEIYVFGDDEAEALIENEGSAQVYEGAEVLVSVSVEEGYVLQSLMVDDEDVTSQMDAEDHSYTFNMPAHDVTITATAVEEVPVESTTYTLATSIESGKTYIIVGQGDGNYYAMGNDRGNNRAAVEISVDGTTATVSSDDVYEFTISSLEEDGFYSIYDAITPGYLYAGSSSANQLKTEAELDENHNGDWEITFNEEGGSANVVATNSSNRNVMQYNRSSKLFSCYASASQHPVYLYVKDETPTTITQTIELTEGWNWVSFYVEGDPIELLDMLKDGLGENASEIQSFEYMIEFDGEDWEGDLNDEGLANDQMYLINAVAECTVTIQGMPAVADSYTITIYPGWNWIGFPNAEPIDVAVALAGFAAEEGDEIQSFTCMTEYDGEDWEGDLETFEPGQGLLYHNTTDEVKTLVFSLGTKKAARRGHQTK